jgi:hypothetical protein
LIERKIVTQRCFKIPTDKLDLFLVKLTMSNNSLSYFECDYIFAKGRHYDVVVNEFGYKCDWALSELESFIEKLWGKDGL